MAKLNIPKNAIKQFVKNVPELLEKHGPSMLKGLGLIGIGVGIDQVDKKRKVREAEDRGFKKGCVYISEIYEKEFKQLTEAFLKKEKDFENDKKEYDNLIMKYEEEIIKLENKVQKSEDEINELKFLLDKKNELLCLKIAV